MSEAVVRPNPVQQLSVRGTRRAAPLAVRGWTGRSAISSVTTTPRPAIATTEEGKTRVSGMRGSPPDHWPARVRAASGSGAHHTRAEERL